MYNKYLVLIVFFTLFVSCKQNDNAEILFAEQEVPRSIWHNNIVIATDLSNRLNGDLYPRSITDEDVTKAVASTFKKSLSQYNRIAMQRDRLSLKLINRRDILNFNDLAEYLTIDLGTFGTNQARRIEYLRGKSEKTLDQDLAQFQETVKQVYEGSKGNYYTSDIWGFLQQGLTKSDFKLTNPTNSPKAVDKSRNILIIITDGYLEHVSQHSGSCPKGNCRLLNSYQLKKFRRACNCKDDAYADLRSILDSSGLGITPVNNPDLANVEVLLLEVFDRSRSVSGSVKEIPSDYSILEAFWLDFFEASGAKRAKVVETANSSKDIEDAITDFVESYDPRSEL